MFPFTVVFLVLLLVYMVYSEWAGLDSRYPIAAGLGLFVVTFFVSAAGAADLANTLAVFVFLLVAGGVVLLMVDYVREGRRLPAPLDYELGLRPWQPQAAQPSQEGQRSSDQPFDGPE